MPLEAYAPGQFVNQLVTGTETSATKPIAEGNVELQDAPSTGGFFDSLDELGGTVASSLGNILGAVVNSKADEITGGVRTDTTGAPADQPGVPGYDPNDTIAGIPKNILIYGGLGLAALGVTIFLMRS